MHKIKEMLMKELYEYEEKAKKMSGGKLSAGDLETLHKLTDTVKNIDKIEILENDEGYSEESQWMGEGRMYGTSYDNEGSYARGRGRNAKRDIRGRYSRDSRSYNDRRSYNDGGSSYEDDMMHRGGGSGYARRGYSYDEPKMELIEKLEELKEETQGEERHMIDKFIHQVKNS